MGQNALSSHCNSIPGGFNVMSAQRLDAISGLVTMNSLMANAGITQTLSTDSSDSKPASRYGF